MTRITTDYLSNPLTDGNQLMTIAEKTAEAIAPIWCDAIAFRGMSGALVAPMVAALLDKPLIMVRKQGTDRHSPYGVEGAVDEGNYIIVDDFVCSGDTIATTIRDIRAQNDELHCVGVVEYNDLKYYSVAEVTAGTIQRSCNRFHRGVNMGAAQ